MNETHQLPWDEIGAFPEPPLTAAEAAQMGGFNFTVETRPSGYRDSHGVWKTNDKRHALVRADTDEFYDYVSPSYYKVTQFRDAFRFVDSYCLEYTAGGTIRKGKQAFLVAKIDPDATMEGRNSFTETYPLYAIFRASHDRTRSLECTLMPTVNRDFPWQAMTFPFSNGNETRFDVSSLTSAQFYFWVDDYMQHFRLTLKRLDTFPVGRNLARAVIDTAYPGKTKRDEFIEGVLYLADTLNGGVRKVINIAEAYAYKVEHAPVKKTTPEAKLWNALQGSTKKALKKLLV